jgi:predicted dithiol-disulfide oxidoreductase (DUF899 family)
MADAQIMADAASVNRWPPNTPQSYITARNELLKQEYALRAQIEQVAALRRGLPKSAVMPSYDFAEGPADLTSDTPVKTTTLASLAADGRSLVTYHFMFDPTDEEPCSMCSMIIDNFNGVSKHLAQNINLAIVAKAPLPALREWARKRNWNNLRFLSSYNCTFNADMGLEQPGYAKDANQVAGVSVFRKDDEGQVRHVYTAFPHIEPGSQRGLDLLASVYNVMDLTPEGRGSWYAENDYA